MPSKIARTAHEDEAMFFENRADSVRLIMSNFDCDVSVFLEMLPRSCGDGSVRIQSIWSAVERGKRIMVPHFTLKQVYLSGRYIGRI